MFLVGKIKNWLLRKLGAPRAGFVSWDCSTKQAALFAWEHGYITNAYTRAPLRYRPKVQTKRRSMERPRYTITKAALRSLSLAALKHTGSRTNKFALWELYLSQGGRCAYSGVPITLGVDCSLDHVAPQSVHGPASLCASQFRWTHKDVNAAKGSLELHDFVGLCRLIVEHCGGSYV